MFLHQTNVLVYPSSITYDEAGRQGDYSSFKEMLDGDSERSSVVDYSISPTLASQVLALTWQCDMWLHVAYGVYLAMLLIRVNCICLVNTLYL